MQRLTPDQMRAAVAAICPKCRAGVAVRQRADTREWVHDEAVRPLVVAHGICWATGLRNSALAPMENVNA